jgi:hypothetical protein
MQVKAFGNMNDNIKLYTSKDKYIYARTKFYRIDNNINEVRVLIDPIDLYFPDGTADFAILSGNEFFMDRVYDKLSTVMSQEIQENVDNYNKIYSKNICDIPNLK